MSNKQRLVLSILEFLNQSIRDGTVKQDDHESLEVAIQCIGEAFGVDPDDQSQVDRLSVKPAALLSIFEVFLKTRDKLASGSAADTPVPAAPSTADKAAADKHKAAGNAQMSAKKYDEAIKSYTQAIALDPTNAVYYSNRAAAYSSKNEHSSAVLDAEKAIETDSSFVKAYHRLGHANYCLSDYKAAAAAFRRGLEIDPSNVSLKSGLQNAETRIQPEENFDDMPPLDPPAREGGADIAGAGAGAGGAPNMAGMADMLRNVGGGGGGGGGGGMPDLGSLMNNPMMMQMAQQMMANGGMERLMQNPSVANMMNRMQSGGGMPSMAELMSDPSLRDM
ncbi:putative stress-induced protein STI1 [Ganoderma leucocontextum]|nr:putative stress-induced protein STI1 [Ganoderma leucocontextum]